MNSREAIKRTMQLVAEKKLSKAVEFARDHFAKNKLDCCVSKDTFKEKVEEAIAIGSGKKDLDFEPQDMVDFMIGQKRVARKLSEEEITTLRRIAQIVEKAEEQKCDHSDAKIVPLMYGGGFAPIEALPELLCPLCGLNITLVPRKGMAKAGLSEEYLNNLLEWSRLLMNNRDAKVQSSRNIPSRLKEVLEESTHYEGDMEPIFKVIDKIKHFSGT